MKKIFWIFLFSFFLCSCATKPSDNNSLQSIETLSEDKFRIYLIREKTFVGLIPSITGSFYPIVIDGRDDYGIPNGSYFYLDLEPGDHEILSESEDLPGKFILNISGKTGETYFVKIEYRTADMQKARFMGGLLGSIVGSAMGLPGETVGGITGSTEARRAEAEQNNGPYRLILVPETEAVNIMEDLEYKL